MRPRKWQSISEIVRAFVDKDRPNHALAALALVLIVPVAGLVCLLLLR